jgi:hypothetical protein
MQKKKLIYIILCIILILSGCSIDSNGKNLSIESNKLEESVNSTEPENESIIKESLEYLISDECNGRLIGTEGNRLAQEYIASKFKEYGLKPYEESYYLPYEQVISRINNSKVKLQLKLPDGKIKDFTYGKDFIESKICNEEIEYPVYTEVENNKNCIVMVESFKTAIQLLNKDNVKGILVKYKELIRTPPTPQKHSNKNIFYITEDTYNTLKENSGQLVKLSMDYKDEKVTLNNIIGKIPGKDGSKAILITAHLDHVGGIGDFIFRGALDNSSGVSILLEVAKKLGEYSKENTFSRDIIFCATNSEETYFTGSKCISQKLSLDYKDFIDINLDCIGEKNRNQLIIDSKKNEKTKEFARNVADYFNESDIKTVVSYNSYESSDHISFTKSILITTGFDSGYLHKVIDTIDKLNIQFMEKVADKLSSFLIQYSLNDDTETIEKDKDLDRVIEIVDREKEKLKFGEYKFIKIDDKVQYVINCNYLGTLEEANKIFNNALLFIPEKLECGELEEVQINAFRSIYFKTPVIDNHKLNKTYIKENLLDDINNITIKYKDTKNQLYTLITAHTFLKENGIEMNLCNQYLKKKEETNNIVDTGNYTFYIVNTEDEQLFDTLIVTKEDENKIYLVSIYGDYTNHKSKDEIVKFIKGNDIENIISNFIELLSK